MSLEKKYIRLLVAPFLVSLFVCCGGGDGVSISFPNAASQPEPQSASCEATCSAGAPISLGISTWRAQNASCECIHAAIQNSATGDTIHVPAGDGDETWTLVLPISKSIHLVGPGQNSLKITLGVSSGYTIKTGVLTGGSISGFEFYTDSAAPAIDIKGTGWRIHHNRYRNTNTQGKNGVFVLANGTNTATRPEGLLDNNEVINGKIIVYGAGNFNNMSMHWASPSSIGTAKSVYIEDNDFSMTANSGSNCTDANRAARYVFRYNNVSQAYAMAHDLQAEGERGTREWEVYGNIFNSFGDASYAAIYMRGGSGNIFYNDTSSTVDYNYTILFQNHRSAVSVDTGGLCNGLSIWDENTTGQNGWLCRDQIGTGQDSAIWSSYTTAGPSQQKTPVYVWGVYNDGVLQSPSVASGSSEHIVANRDYYTHTLSFDGLSGVGCGQFANRPVACSPGVAYWATNQSCTNLTGMIGVNPITPIAGTLYKCTAPNTWTAYYTPYPYPHPLRN